MVGYLLRFIDENGIVQGKECKTLKIAKNWYQKNTPKVKLHFAFIFKLKHYKTCDEQMFMVWKTSHKEAIWHKTYRKYN